MVTAWTENSAVDLADEAINLRLARKIARLVSLDDSPIRFGFRDANGMAYGDYLDGMKELFDSSSTVSPHLPFGNALFGRSALSGSVKHGATTLP